MDENLDATLSALGARIRALRKLNGLSQEQLAELTGSQRRSISELESGKINPTLKTLANVARALSVHVSELLDVPSEPNVYVLTRRQMQQLETTTRTIDLIKEAAAPMSRAKRRRTRGRKS